ncbi:hypothetical protein LAUMK4_05811 [Mycobacterium persicum]|uniref:Uncharacterized protein n=1 Tax=Mycobacterium persicum TaxID=1487726 RepID=A0ABY6RSF1_9MYCO|nr:hypothetical protein LAUMK4_05811 [Mycobacterium persicum]
MSLADRLPHITSDRKLCTTCSWLAGLPDRDRAAFDQLIKRDDISTTQLLGICQVTSPLYCDLLWPFPPDFRLNPPGLAYSEASPGGFGRFRAGNTRR